jgi:hypothetical protein
MLPTWAEVVANAVKLPPRTQRNVSRDLKPTGVTRPGVWGPTPFEAEVSKPKKRSHQQKVDPINTNREEPQSLDILYEPVVMEPTQEPKPSPHIEAKPAQDSHETKPSTPVPETAPPSSLTPPPTGKRITTETRAQLLNGIWTSTSIIAPSQIIDSYFRSPQVQNSLSHIICADPFCRNQIPHRGIKGRWAMCEECHQKTCIMSSCSLLERSHLNGGWEICPDGAAGMGLERIARAKTWTRCKECHRFLVKVEGDPKGRSVPCEACKERGERYGG